jgi:hypothetical protein
MKKILEHKNYEFHFLCITVSFFFIGTLLHTILLFVFETTEREWGYSCQYEYR